MRKIILGRKLCRFGVLLCFLCVLLGAMPALASCGCKITYANGATKKVLGVETNLLNNVDGCYCNDESGGSVMEIIINIVNILTGIVAPLAVLGIIIAGVTYMTARDNAAQAAKAKTRIFQVGLGLVAFMLMWTFLNWLIPGGIFNASGGSGVTNMVALSKSEVAALEQADNTTTTTTPSTTTPSTTTPSTTTPSSTTPSTTPSTTTPSTATPSTTTPSTAPSTTPSTNSTLPNSSADTTFTSYYSTGTNVNFLLYEPSTAAGRKLPLIVYLHGDSGHGTTASAIQYIVGISEFSNWNANSLYGINAYILCPQTRTRDSNWGNNPSLAARDEVWKKIKSMIAEGKVDPSRVSIMGQSRGSYGVQYFVTDSGRVGKFSAAVLLSGYYVGKDLSNAPPMKFIYGGNDTSVVQNGGIASFRSYGAEIKKYDGKGHDSVIGAALLDDANGDHKSDLIEWVLSKTAKSAI